MKRIGLIGYLQGEKQYVIDERDIEELRSSGVPVPEKIDFTTYTPATRRKGGLILFDRGLKTPYGHISMPLGVYQKVAKGFCVFLDGYLLKIAIWPFGVVELTPRWFSFSR